MTYNFNFTTKSPYDREKKILLLNSGVKLKSMVTVNFYDALIVGQSLPINM